MTLVLALLVVLVVLVLALFVQEDSLGREEGRGWLLCLGDCRQWDDTVLDLRVDFTAEPRPIDHHRGFAFVEQRGDEMAVGFFGQELVFECQLSGKGEGANGFRCGQ